MPADPQPSRLSDTQGVALRVAAALGPNGGRITIDRHEGGYWRPSTWAEGHFSTITIRALLARGFVEEYGWRYNSRGRFCVSVAITDAGRAALAEVRPRAK